MTTTELFFRQAVGRFVRWTPGLGRQPAYLYIPDDPRLRRAAAEVAQRRRHSLRRGREQEAQDVLPADPLAVEEREENPADAQLSLFSVISAVATDAVLPEDELDDDEPHLIDDDPSLVIDLPSPPPLGGGTGSGDGAGTGRAEQKEELRRANHDVARAIARRTGRPHAEVNAELNRLAGVTTISAATLEQLERRLRHALAWRERA